MRRLLVTLLTLVIIASTMMSGCSGDKEAEQKEQQQEAQVNQEESDSENEESKEKMKREESEMTLEELKEEMKKIMEVRDDSKGYYCEYVMSTDYGEGELVESRMKTWQQERKMKTELIDADGNTMSIMIQDTDEDVMYIYDVSQNIAMKYTGLDEGDTDEDFEAQGDEDIDWDAVVDIKNDKLDGKNVKQITIKDVQGEGQFESKMWIDEKTGIAVQVENYMDGKMVSEMRTEKIEQGPFEEEVFKLPSGVKIMDVESYMPDMEMPETPNVDELQ